jgi:hypothetical protein
MPETTVHLPSKEGEPAWEAVLVLEGEQYMEHGVFTPGQTATSSLLSDFQVPVTAALQPK